MRKLLPLCRPIPTNIEKPTLDHLTLSSAVVRFSSLRENVGRFLAGAGEIIQTHYAWVVLRPALLFPWPANLATDPAVMGFFRSGRQIALANGRSGRNQDRRYVK